MNAEGDDMNPSGTAKATSKAVSQVMQDPNAADFRSKFSQQSGSPSKQSQTFFKFGNNAIQNLPSNVLSKTSPSNVLYGMQKAMGANGFVQKPSYMKKRMKKK